MMKLLLLFLCIAVACATNCSPSNNRCNSNWQACSLQYNWLLASDECTWECHQIGYCSEYGWCQCHAACYDNNQCFSLKGVSGLNSTSADTTSIWIVPIAMSVLTQFV